MDQYKYVERMLQLEQHDFFVSYHLDQFDQSDSKAHIHVAYNPTHNFLRSV